MTWLFSRALVEAFLPITSSATEPCAQLSVMPTPRSFWRNGKTMDYSRLSRFGLTCAPLTAPAGEALLTAFLAAFPARTLASPAPVLGLKVSGPASGSNSLASFARWSPSQCAWRTAQCSLLGDSAEFLETFPRWGSMRSGVLFQRPTLAPGMSVSGFGSLLPTLTVSGNDNRPYPGKASGYGLASALKMMPTLVARDYRHPGKSRLERTGSTAGDHLPNSVGGPLNPDWCEWFMGWPVGWTALKPLATDKFQEWQQQHSACLPPAK